MAKTKRMPIRKKEREDRDGQMDRVEGCEEEGDGLVLDRIKKGHLRKNIINKLRKHNKMQHFLRRKTAYDMNVQFISEDGPQKFHCPICMEIMLAPSLLLCGHTFCLNCIEQSLKYNKTCSLCREDFDYESPIASKMMESFIQKTMQVCQDQEERKGYAKRVKAHRFAFEEVRVGSSVKVGDNVDIYVKNGWESATVQGLRKIGKNSTILKVKSSSSTTSEVLIDSRLLAKQGTFTKPKPKPQAQYTIPWRRSSQIFEPLLFFDFSIFQMQDILEI